MNDDEKLKGEIAILKAIWALALKIPGLLITGWCVSLMWLWFVVPLGVKDIPVAQAIGLVSLAFIPHLWMAGALSKIAEVKAEAANVTGNWVAMQIAKLMILGECWIIHHFFM